MKSACKRLAFLFIFSTFGILMPQAESLVIAPTIKYTEHVQAYRAADTKIIGNSFNAPSIKARETDYCTERNPIIAELSKNSSTCLNPDTANIPSPSGFDPFSPHIQNLAFDTIKSATAEFFMPFLLTTFSKLIHELGHACVRRVSTGFWPYIFINYTPSPYNDAPSIKIGNVILYNSFPDVMQNGYSMASHEEEEALYKTLSDKFPALTLDETGDQPKLYFSANRDNNQQDFGTLLLTGNTGKTAAIIRYLAGPTMSTFGLLAIKNFLPDNKLLHYIWLLEVILNTQQLLPFTFGTDGHQALSVAGIYPTNTAQNIINSLGKEIPFTIFKVASIKELLKYWALGRAVLNKNVMCKLKAAALYFGLLAMDYVEPAQKATDIIKAQKISLIESTQQTAQEFLPFGWGDDIVKSTISWMGAIALYLMIMKAIPHFNPLNGKFQ